MNHLFFIDKDCECNLSDGLPYYAAGIIENDYRNQDGTGHKSGKDYAVAFIDPWGNFQREWRAIDEIRIIEASEEDYNKLKESIETVWNRENIGLTKGES